MKLINLKIRYYTNTLFLPVINGPCEGCLALGTVFLLTAINGMTIFRY